MNFYYDSRNEFHKVPFGAVSTGKKVKFKINARDGVLVYDMYLRLTKDGEECVRYPMIHTDKQGDISYFTCDLLLNEAGLYWYSFVADTELGVVELFKGTDNMLTITGDNYQLTVYDKTYSPPKLMMGGIIYHIFVDRFNKGKDADAVWQKTGVLKDWHEDVTIVDSDGVFRANDFYGGNLQGIIDKLGYLSKLGVTLLYLSPIFKSSSNHRYDTGDYMQIDELLGSEKSFKRLIKEAKKYGIGVMLDGVFNHTGSDSVYFNQHNSYPSLGAFQSKDSPYFDWYYFDEFPNKYGCWWGIGVTPTVNKKNEAYRRFLFDKGGVLDKWTRCGLAGWRLDVVDELDIEFVDKINDTVSAINPDVAIIGEVWEDASNKIAYSTRRPYLLGGQLDGVMNYPFKSAILKYARDNNDHALIASIMTIYENYPLDALNCSMTFLGTHDTVRAINSLSDVNISGTSKLDRLHIDMNDAERSVARERLKIASILQYVLPGVPSIYYGDEIGLEGYEDPINRMPFPWDDIDDELLEHYRGLGRLRTEHKDIFSGSMFLTFRNGMLYIYRFKDDESICIILNNSPSDQYITGERGRDFVTGNVYKEGQCMPSGSYIAIIR